jgi:hypothetical protein
MYGGARFKQLLVRALPKKNGDVPKSPLLPIGSPGAVGRQFASDIHSDRRCGHRVSRIPILEAGRTVVTILIYYLAIMLVFNAATVAMGFLVERMWGSGASLVVFLSLYFVTLWLAWIIAVWLTKPNVAVVAVRPAEAR